jgi:hypothetical protein
MDDPKAELDRHLAWLEGKLPRRVGNGVAWLRKPSSIYVRVPAALALVLGGIFSFLPVLGIWMLPLGLVLVAQDVPPLQRPLARLLNAVERRWMGRRDDNT